MRGFLGKHPEAIGIEIGTDGIRMAQLSKGDQKHQLQLLGARMCDCPEQIQSGTVQWQHWMVDTMKNLLTEHRFSGKIAVGGIPTSDTVLETVRLPKLDQSKLDDFLFGRIRSQWFSDVARDEVLIKHICPDSEHVVIMAARREQINRHLATFERAGLTIRSLCVWPESLVNCYIHFFGRRKTDKDAVVMLIDIEPACTNVVICRYTDILLARSIPILADTLNEEKSGQRLTLEVLSCRREMMNLYRHIQIDRLVFLSGHCVDEQVYTQVAKQLAVQTQIGDCLMAVKSNAAKERESESDITCVSWATAFGLSLS